MASVSKTFLALGVLRLSEKGKLTLQDRVADLVPDVRFTNPWADQAPVRVVHVLEHTTGFDEIHAHRVSGQGLSTKLVWTPIGKRATAAGSPELTFRTAVRLCPCWLTPLSENREDLRAVHG